MSRLRAFGTLLGLVFAISAFGDEASPGCFDQGRNLPILNTQVAKWKATTRNEFMARARVTGVLSKIYPTKNGHAHFQIEMDGTRSTLEVVYSLDFGKLPRLAEGMEIEACGDYITSFKATSKYPPSPDGALIHWIHRSTSRHEHGFLMIDGRLYGKGSGRSFMPDDQRVPLTAN